MSIKDILPQPPWEGPPVPKSVWSKTLTLTAVASIIQNLEDTITQLAVLQQRLPAFIKNIKPYIKQQEVDTFKRILGLHPSFKDIREAHTIATDIQAHGLK